MCVCVCIYIYIYIFIFKGDGILVWYLLFDIPGKPGNHHLLFWGCHFQVPAVRTFRGG